MIEVHTTTGWAASETSQSLARVHERQPMKTALAALPLLFGLACGHPIPEEPLLFISDASLLKHTQHAADQMRPLYDHPLEVIQIGDEIPKGTNWTTWRVSLIPPGRYAPEDIQICGDVSASVDAVCDYSVNTLWIGDCQMGIINAIVAHEFGHVFNAGEEWPGRAVMDPNLRYRDGKAKYDSIERSRFKEGFAEQ